MSDWLLHLPVLWMGLLIFAGIYLATAGLHRGIAVLAVGERARIFKAISPSVLAPLATIYALLFGFLAAQVWSDADRATRIRIAREGPSSELHRRGRRKGVAANGTRKRVADAGAAAVE